MEKGALWRRVIAVKYSLDDRLLLFHSVVITGNNWSHVMSDLVKLLKGDSLLSVGFKKGMACKVGNEVPKIYDYIGCIFA